MLAFLVFSAVAAVFAIAVAAGILRAIIYAFFVARELRGASQNLNTILTDNHVPDEARK